MPRDMPARTLVAALLAVAMAGCADIPRDPERTEALVRETRTIRLGWVEGTKPDADAAAALAELERTTEAKVERRAGDSEMLLRELEDGRIDLVYGSFAQDSPWAKKVHFAHALGWRAEPPKTVEALRFALRNGENGWIMRVEAASRP